MASFAIEPAFWELFPQAEIGIVVARGIDNAHESSEDVKAALAEANKAALAHVPDPTISKNPAVAVWREAFQQFKTKKGARSSIEALLKRASGGREVGSINPLVDIYNTVSLTYALPCGGEDIDTFAGDLRLTVTAGRRRSARWATRPIPRRCRARCAYLDDAGAVCRCWNWRDGVRTMLTASTTNAFLILESVDPARHDDLAAALDDLAARTQAASRRRDGIPYRDEGQPGDRPVVSALVALARPCISVASPVRL